MRRALLKLIPPYSRQEYFRPSFRPNRVSSPLPLSSSPLRFRLFSSENDSSNEHPKPSEASSNENLNPSVASPGEIPNRCETSLTQEPNKDVTARLKDVTANVKDVDNTEFKRMINLYLKGNEEMLPSIMEAILARRLSGKHEETDSEIMEELEIEPLDDAKDQDVESDFEELHDTDEEVENLYNARQIVEKRMVKDEYFNMDDTKWDEMIKEATEKGYLADTGECERILEDMLSWDKLLPDEIKQKVEKRFNELGDMCERGELEPEEAYKLFKEFEDQMVLDCAKIMEAEQPSFDAENSVPDKNVELDDPPGEGPILRWQTRVVFAPGGDAWHPKNRKVKLSVTVKELGLSKYAFRRLRELIGKRYNSGKDELTITSERYEAREENRKDCLRTLYSLIEEAAKADKFVEEARVSYVKERLKANPKFMERLRVKKMEKQASIPAISS